MVDPVEFIRDISKSWSPPRKLKLSEWADEYFYLSPESSASPGRWHTIPYQREIMDCISDPHVEKISWKKSARVGATKILNATIGYFIHHDPCPILAVQPSVEDAKGYSKEEIVPMLRDCSVLSDLVADPKSKTSENTILSKTFPGGLLTLIGANSPRGFRRVSRRIVMFDEVDAYPPSAGSEGDPIELGIKRTGYFWNRKIIAVSTPVTHGKSKIDQMFSDGDMRRYHVPCPSCGHMDVLSFFGSDGAGHVMAWPDGDPGDAHFVCSRDGCKINESDKSWMIENGKWVAEKEFSGHASFSIWSAYSFAPDCSWPSLARKFERAKGKGTPEAMQVFVNTELGETYQEVGEAPPYIGIYARREDYQIGVVPKQVKMVTMGVDVQKDRLIFEIVGWDHNLESWSIDYGILPGDTSSDGVWDDLDLIISRPLSVEGSDDTMKISLTAIDSGYNTQMVYQRCSRWPRRRVVAVKGSSRLSALVGTPSDVEIKISGKRFRRGYKVWIIGSDVAKSELYGFLSMEHDGDGQNPDSPRFGWCHFPEYGEEFFRQLTSENLIARTDRRGYKSMTWEVIPGRENHVLDVRVYARCAACIIGLDRISSSIGRNVTKQPDDKEPPPIVPKHSDNDRQTGSNEISTVNPSRTTRRRKNPWIKRPRGGRWI